MALGPVSEQFLREVEAVTGLPVQVEMDDRLQSPLLARIQVARGGVPVHRVSYHPNAGSMADYLIAFQCSFVLRLHAVPESERYDLTDTDSAVSDSLEWTKSHPASASLSAERQKGFAEFLRTSMMSMLRSIPVGLRIDLDLRAQYPELRAPQEQAIRRQIETHASLLRPDIQQSIPGIPLRLNLAMNAAFAKVWGRELGQGGWTLPYLAAGVLSQGETLLKRSEALTASPENDRRLIQAWADELGLGSWIRWKPYAP